MTAIKYHGTGVTFSSEGLIKIYQACSTFSILLTMFSASFVGRYPHCTTPGISQFETNIFLSKAQNLEFNNAGATGKKHPHQDRCNLKLRMQKQSIKQYTDCVIQNTGDKSLLQGGIIT